MLNYILSISILLGVGISIMNLLLTKESKTLNPLTGFESGFSSLSKGGKSFSLHFYLIMVIFVLFDLEIVLLLVLLWEKKSAFYLLILTLSLVYLGLLLEWKNKKLSWSI